MGEVVNEGKTGSSRLGTVLDGRYRIDSLLRRGRSAAVYAGQHLPLGRAIAVKVMDPEDLGDDIEAASRRFYESAAAAAQLKHPANVTVLDFGKTPDGALYVVMEYAEGRRLSEIVRDQGPLPAGRTVALVRQVCRALKEAHSRNFIHRDVKSSNIVVATTVSAGMPPDAVKLIDFALVRRLDESAEVTETSDSAANLGSSLYVAPEQVLGEPEDARTDIYGVGVVLYEALTGRTPFRGRTQVETLLAHVQSEPPPLLRDDGIEIPATLSDIVLRCLAKAKADRFSSMSELLDALSKVPFEGAQAPAQDEAPLEIDIDLSATEARVEPARPGRAASGLTDVSSPPPGEHDSATATKVAHATAFDHYRRPVPPVATYRVGAGLPLTTSRSHRRGRWVALLSVLVGFAVGTFFFLRTQPGELRTDVMGVMAAEPASRNVSAEAVIPPRPGATAAPESDKSRGADVPSVILTFRTDPAGATVYAGRDIYGPTPASVQWVGDRARPGQTHTFRIERDGYVPQQVTRTLVDGDVEVRVTLQPNGALGPTPRRRVRPTAIGRPASSMTEAVPDSSDEGGEGAKVVDPGDAALRRALEALDRSQSGYRGAANTYGADEASPAEPPSLPQGTAAAARGASTGATQARSDSPRPTAKSAPVAKPDDMSMPRLVSGSFDVAYPMAARRGGEAGRVTVRFAIDEDGRVRRIRVLRGKAPFANAVKDAAREWLFERPMHNGVPQAIWVTRVFVFTSLP